MATPDLQRYTKKIFLINYWLDVHVFVYLNWGKWIFWQKPVSIEPRLIFFKFCLCLYFAKFTGQKNDAYIFHIVSGSKGIVIYRTLIA